MVGKSSRLSLSLIIVILMVWGVAPWCYYTAFTVSGEVSMLDYNSDNTRIILTDFTAGTADIYDPIYYQSLHSISVAGRKVHSARFTKDTNYLAVGLDNGTVLFLDGKSPYSNTPLFTIDVEAGKKIRDIGFNSGNMNMIVCF